VRFALLFALLALPFIGVALFAWIALLALPFASTFAGPPIWIVDAAAVYWCSNGSRRSHSVPSTDRW
jgi:hypothetical protein